MQYVENFADGTVILLIHGAIGRDEDNPDGVDGAMFAQVMNYLNTDPDVTEFEVRINSHGGGVMDALNIFNAIRNSKKPVTTVIEGIAASSGGLIAMAGHTRKMNDFARLMVHAPSLPDKVREQLDENTVKMLDQFQDLIADLLTSNSRHNKAKIMSMIDAETWFNAEQALDAGFVDEIVNTDRQFEDIFNELDLNNTDLSLVVNQLSNHKNIIKMEKIKNTLGLDKNVSEQVVEAKIEEIVNNAEKAKNDLTAEKEAHDATKAKLSAAENKVNEINDAAAVEFVENAIKDGKFKAENKEALIEQAKANLEGFKALADSIATPAKKITDQIDPSGEGSEAGKVVNGKLDGKTLRELEKSNPTLVKDLIKNDREAYVELYKAQYNGAEPTFA